MAWNKTLKEIILHSFLGSSDDTRPWSSLVEWDEGLYRPNHQTNLVIVRRELSSGLHLLLLQNSMTRKVDKVR